MPKDVIITKDGTILIPKTPIDVVEENNRKNLKIKIIDPKSKNTAKPINPIADRAEEPTKPVIPQ